MVGAVSAAGIISSPWALNEDNLSVARLCRCRVFPVKAVVCDLSCVDSSENVRTARARPARASSIANAGDAVLEPGFLDK